MADYQDIRASFWSDPKVEAWSPAAKLLGLYLLTNPMTNVLGLYLCSAKTAKQATGLSRRIFQESWERLQTAEVVNGIETAPFFLSDAQRGMVWVVNFFKYRPHSPQVKIKATELLTKAWPMPLAHMAAYYYRTTVSLPSGYRIDTVSIPSCIQKSVSQKSVSQSVNEDFSSANAPPTNCPKCLKSYTARITEHLACIGMN